MTKIKNFRISLRPREIARWLKNERKLILTPELEAAIEHQVRDTQALLQPAAIYTTLTRALADKTTPVALPEGSIALSIIAASVGPAVEGRRLAAEERQDILQESLLAGVQQEALHQALQFALRLVQEQAKEEDCELSAPTLAPDPQLLGPLATLVGIQRIGIDWDTSRSWPSGARLVWTFWTPLVKNHARKPDTRAEKTAV